MQNVTAPGTSESFSRTVGTIQNKTDTEQNRKNKTKPQTILQLLNNMIYNV